MASSHEMQEPLLPSRTSSKKEQWQEQHLTLRASKQDLKRKLSTVSFDKSPLEYSRFKIQELDAEQDDERHQKKYLDLELETKGIDMKQYRTKHKAANQRISSLGDEKWKHSQMLRSLEEKQGQIQSLGPDSEGAYVAALLRLYKDQHRRGGRNSTIQFAMRTDAIQKYEPAKSAPRPRALWCPITQEYYSDIDIRCAHIVPAMLGPELVDYTFGRGSGSRLHRADNCLLLEMRAEQHFDKGHFVLVPVDPTESPIKRWKVHVTTTDCVNDMMGRASVKDFDGRELVFLNDNRPAARFLYYHFVITLLRNKHYRRPGWEDSLEKFISQKPFPTPGRYLRESMLLTLARRVGDLSVEEERKLCDPDLTFSDSERLLPVEEDEIARRMLETTEEP
ncbi:MAG: hypothetical protein Q9217_003915 [Psora testacea]